MAKTPMFNVGLNLIFATQREGGEVLIVRDA